MRRELRKFGEWLDGGDLLTASRADCERFLADRGEVSPATAHMAWRALRSFYAFLAQEDDVPNVMRNVRAPKVPEPATKVATEDEYQALVRYLDREAKRVGGGGTGFEYRRARALLALLWDTGLRRGELQALRVDDLDLDNGALIVRTSKAGKPRIVPFTDSTAKLLYAYLRARACHDWSDDPALWFGLRGPLGNDGIRQIIEKTAEGAGVQVSAHEFRRAFAQRWLSAGGSQASLMAVAGWSSPTMPSRYTRSVAAEVAKDEYRRIFH